MINKYIFLILILYNYSFGLTLSGKTIEGYFDNDDNIDTIICSESKEYFDYKCIINYKNKSKLINGNYEGKSFEIHNQNKGELEISSFDYFSSKYYIYKYKEDNWYLLSYEFMENAVKGDIEDYRYFKIYFKPNQYLIDEFMDFTNPRFKIQTQKQYLYKEANENTKTRMYLLKDDVVEILEEKDDWIYILYNSKDNKEIKAWIPKNALEF